MAEMSDPKVLEKYRSEAANQINCKEVSDRAKLRQLFSTLAKKKWDRAGMGCGVGYGKKLADTAPEDLELQIQTLLAHIEYFGVLNSAYADHYQGIEQSSELWVRWNQTRAGGAVLVDRLVPHKDVLPEARLAVATYAVASTQRESTSTEMGSARGGALPEFLRVVEDKPEALGGVALLFSGEMLLSLPEFLGGDSLQAISLLEKGISINPENLMMYRALVEGYLGEREPEEAVALLKKALKVSPDSQNPQDYVDQMKLLGGMAVRVGQPKLAKDYGKVIEKVFAKTPQLLTRKKTASFGHGGVDPITGEDPDAL